MTEKELKKLNRYQLLELIILQTQQIDSLKEELRQTREQLESQQIRVSQAGSIAEAALQLNDIFETAQSTADLYLQRVKQRDNQIDEIESAARRKLQDAESQAEKIIENAKRHADDILQLARKQSADILEQTYITSEQFDDLSSEKTKRGFFRKNRGN